MKGTPNEPHEAKCVGCGKTFLKTHNRQQLCDECRKTRKREYENRRRAKTYNNVKPKAQKPEPEEDGPDPSECLHRESCIYGDPTNGAICNYFMVTGKLRTAGGKHMPVNGKCDLYKRRTGKNVPGWQRKK